MLGLRFKFNKFIGLGVGVVEVVMDGYPDLCKNRVATREPQ